MHSDAATAADTDWRQILQLYDQLLQVAPTPVVALNRAVAVAEVDGPAGGPGAAWRVSTSTATTCSTPSGPISCGGSAGTPTRPWPMTRPSPAQRTAPSGTFSSAAAENSQAYDPGGRGTALVKTLEAPLRA